jgi:hypothetical protein
LKIRFLTGNSAEMRLGVNCTSESMNKTDRNRGEVRWRVKHRQERLPLLRKRRCPRRFADTPRCPSLVPSTILIVESYTLLTLASWAALTKIHAVLGVYTSRALA